MPAKRMIFHVKNSDLISEIKKGNAIEFIPGIEGQ